MKNASIFSTTLLILSALFLTQTAQAQLNQNTVTKSITTNTDFNNAANAILGVGTATPSNAKLNVQGAVGNTVASFRKSATGKGVSIVSDWPGVYFNSYFNGSGKSMAPGYAGIVNFDPDQGRFDFALTGTAATAANTNLTLPSRMCITKDGNVGIGTTSPLKLLHVNGDALINNNLSFPNTLGNKVTFWSNGPQNDFGIGINSGVMQLYTAGQDKIAMGWGNTSNFKETIRFLTGPGQIGFQNTVGNKISFWNSGPNNDFGIGINSGVMQLYTAGQDKIAFGYGNANNFTETMSLYTGTGQLGLYTLPVNGYRLAVNGKVICEELKVQLKSAWPDYVFSPNYKLRTLEEVEAHIKSENHLPGIPAAAELEKDGLEVGDMQKRMMEKIEELTLYLIDQNKRLEQLEQDNGTLHARLDKAESTQK
ncbi:MAG: hypothetical protein H7246_04670 [Phycisphaerae bacterium]|nr:hypothetical protein [Saprospiraceae bacterium]